MIMTLSMKKIVESRNRRGGASLHRNLLVAGVLFKARDVLLAVTAAADSSEKPSATDYSAEVDIDVDRKSGDDDEMECEQTGAEMASPSSSSSLSANVCSMLNDKENVPPDNQPASDHPRCDDIQPSTDKTRAVKRQSRDVVDDDVTPCKTTRADMDVADVDNVVASSTVNDVVCRQTYSSMPVSPSSSSRQAIPPCAVKRSSTVSRLAYYLTQNVADPVLVRPLFVVQVV